MRALVTVDAQAGTGGPAPPDGFFVQAHEPDCRAETSDGLFVHTGSSPVDVEPGDLVAIHDAEVTEFDRFGLWPHSLTELSCTTGCSVARLDTDRGLPSPLDYDPPRDPDSAGVYKEAREGMRAIVQATVTAMGPSNAFDEVVVDRGAERPRALASQGARGDLIRVDASSVSSARCGQAGLEPVKTLDQLEHAPDQDAALTGVVSTGFGGHRLMLDDASACPAVTSVDAPYDPRGDPAPAAGPSQVRVATLNAFNLFDTDDDPAKDDPVLPRSVYERKLEKLARTVCAEDALATPDAVGVQEIENQDVLDALVDEIEDRCGVSYDAVTREAPDDRSIQNGLIARSATTEILATRARQACDDVNRGVDDEGFTTHIPCLAPEPYQVFNRPPLEVTLALTETQSPNTPVLTLLVNHFKSQLPSPNCQAIDCTDWRLVQADRLREMVDTYDQLGHDAVVVLGDLNDELDSDPLDVLVEDGPLTNLWHQTDADTPPYSLIYQGTSQALDHVLVPPAIADAEANLAPVHLGADWPATARGDATTFLGASDHDPLVATVTPPGVDAMLPLPGDG